MTITTSRELPFSCFVKCSFIGSMISQRERGRFHGFGGGFGAEDFTGAMPGDLDDSGVGDDSGCVTFKGVGNGRMLVNPELQRIAIGQIGGGDASADAHQGASA